MKIYIDSAEIKQIERIADKFVVQGVTTNPTLLAREKRNPLETLREIKVLIGNELDLHVQVLSVEALEMIEEAKRMRELIGEKTFVKIPVTLEGIKAMKILSKEGINITATAIYTPMQALLAANAGAKWTAPYVNRLDMIGADGVQVANDIHHILEEYHSEAKLLAASFKNVEQVLRIAKAGGTAITAAPEILDQLLYHPLTDKAVKNFIEDFEGITKTGMTFLDF